MKFTQAVKTCIAKTFTFSGRARRSEYWYWVLFCFCITFIAAYFCNAANINWPLKVLSVILFVPSLAVSIRRLHDIGKSGFWYLLTFIPVVGSIVIFIFACKDSQLGDNQYGPDPKFRVSF